MPDLNSNDDLTPQETKKMIRYLNESMNWVFGELKTKSGKKEKLNKSNSNSNKNLFT